MPNRVPTSNVFCRSMRIRFLLSNSSLFAVTHTLWFWMCSTAWFDAIFLTFLHSKWCDISLLWKQSFHCCCLQESNELSTACLLRWENKLFLRQRCSIWNRNNTHGYCVDMATTFDKDHIITIWYVLNYVIIIIDICLFVLSPYISNFIVQQLSCRLFQIKFGQSNLI